MNVRLANQPRIANGFATISRMPAPRQIYRVWMSLPPANRRFRVVIHRAGGCYFAQVVDVPGCFSRGASEVEALENARSTLRAYLWLANAIAGDKATVQLEITA